MVIIGIVPQHAVSYPTKLESLRLAVVNFRETYPGAELVAVDGRDVVSICENCDLPILEGDRYWHDRDGINWHVDCDDPA
jgi:hypothetical protein